LELPGFKLRPWRSKRGRYGANFQSIEAKAGVNPKSEIFSAFFDRMTPPKGYDLLLLGSASTVKALLESQEVCKMKYIKN
jgi:hypothetical protein